LAAAILWDCVSLGGEAKPEASMKNSTMKHKTIVTIAVGVITLLACSAATHAVERPANAATFANGSGYVEARYVRKRRPMQVEIYSTRRRRGYSYQASDVVNTYGRSPPPYAEVRQTPGGPFDSGFFFDSGIGPHGGNSIYQH
jgi:hypothetical protein